MKSGIYMLLNTTTNKFYIGSAVNLLIRKYDHFLELKENIHKNSHLQRAYNKQWGLNFEFHVIQYCSIENLLVCEQWWFDLTHCWNDKIGYNICRIAGSMLGTKQTKEHILKRVSAREDYSCSEETKKKISKTLKGNKLSLETREKMSKSRKGKQYRLGTKTSEETKLKLSKAGKGRKHSAETIAKIKATKNRIKFPITKVLELH